MALPSGLLEISLPGDATLTIRQGSTWRQPLRIKSGGAPADLSVGVTASLKVKNTWGGSLLETAVCTIPIGTDGVVICSLTPAETAALTVAGTTRIRQLGLWDLFLTDGADSTTVVGGIMNLYMRITD